MKEEQYEKKEENETYKKSRYTEVGAGYYTGASNCPKEQFPSVKVFFLEEGDCEIAFSDTLIRLKENELIVFNEEEYSLRSENKNSRGILLFVGLDYFHLHIFHPAWKDPFFSEFILCVFDAQLRRFRYSVYSVTEENRLAILMRGALEEMQDSRICTESAKSCYLFLLFIQLAREYAGEFGEVLWNKHLDYSSLIHYLDENYMKATLDSTAKHFNFSPSYISRFLKKHTGKSFMEHIHQRRMEAAEHILRHADMPVTKIANIIGYRNVSFFYRLFEKYYGCTPVEYRKKALKR